MNATATTATTRKHRAQAPTGLALEVNLRNVSAMFHLQADAIDGMTALHEMDIPACLMGAERDAFREQKRRAFGALADVARMTGPLWRMNNDHAELKSDSTKLNASIAEVDKAAKERADRRKGTR